MTEIWAWMSRDDVVLMVSVISIVINLLGLIVMAMLEARR